MRFPEERSERNDGRNAKRNDAASGGERVGAADANVVEQSRFHRRRFKGRSSDFASSERRSDGNEKKSGDRGNGKFENGCRAPENRRNDVRNGRAARVEPFEGNGRPERNGWNGRAARVETFEGNGRPERNGRAARVEPFEGNGRPERNERNGRAARVETFEGNGRPERNERNGRAARVETFEGNGRPERNDRNNRNYWDNRGDRDAKNEKNGWERNRGGRDFGASAARFAQIDENRLLQKLIERTPPQAFIVEPRPINWSALEEIFAEWVEPMKASPQNADHHAEGDVWTHTKMVCETLIELTEWGTLSPTRRALTFLAALWHDVGKPRCVRYRNGRVTTPKHGPKGAAIARRLLIEKCGYDGDPDLIEFREQICCLVENHTKPRCFRDFYCKNEELARVASRTSCDWLALISEADVKGRLGVSPGSRLAKIEFFRRFSRRWRASDDGAANES